MDLLNYFWLNISKWNGVRLITYWAKKECDIAEKDYAFTYIEVDIYIYIIRQKRSMVN